MIIIDGKKAAATLREELKKKISELKSTYNAVPGLTVILVGEDPPSKIYVRNKEKFAIEVGINSEVIRYPENVEEKVVLNKTIENLRKINKSWLCVSPDSDQDVFFSSKGIFIRKVVMMLDYYYERSELHQVLQKCLARAYLIRMDNHYQRANAHFRS